MIHWFKDQHFRSLVKNAGYLGGGRIVAALANAATLALAAHGLGLLTFGILVLITSYVRAVDGIAKFQSWQVIVRYGGHGVAHGDPRHFRVATGFAFSLDMLTGLGGMAVGAALLPLIGGWLGITPQFLWLGMLYCTLLPIMNSATPDGVLRVHDRFDLLSAVDTITPISRALLCATAFLLGAGLTSYVAIWYATDLLGAIALWALGWRELRRHGHLGAIRPTLTPRTLPRAWRFAVDVNLASGVEAVWGPIARLLVGALLGPSGAALFRAASSLADVAQKPGELLGKAFFPEIVRMDFASGKPWKLMLRGSGFLTAIAIVGIGVMVVGGKPLTSLFFGEAFVGAYRPLIILMAVPLIGIFTFPLTPMLYALGRSDAPLKAKVLGSAVFFLSIAPLCWQLGVAGAALALVLANIATAFVMVVQLKGEHARVRGAETANLPPQEALTR